MRRAAALALLVALATPALAQEPRTEAKPPEPALRPTDAPGVAAPAPDLAFGAFQRGYFVTALKEAMKRIEANPGDAAAMTLVGELYGQGLGMKRNPQEAARWFRLAADRGDRQAIFALGLARLRGEGRGAGSRRRRWPCWKRRPDMGHAGASYNLGVAALENDGVTSQFARAAEHFRQRRRSRRFGRRLFARPAPQDRARASGRTSARPPTGSAAPPRTTIWRRSSNWRSCSSTARAWRRTRPPPPNCSSRRRDATIRSRKTAWPGC
jgi:hypothetical protein